MSPRESNFLQRVSGALRRELEKTLDPEVVAAQVGQAIRGEKVVRKYERRRVPAPEGSPVEYDMVEVRREVTTSPQDILAGLEVAYSLYGDKPEQQLPAPALKKMLGAAPTPRINIFSEDDVVLEIAEVPDGEASE